MSNSEAQAIPVLAKGRRKSLSMDHDSLVAFSPMFEGHSLPLLCTPKVAGINLANGPGRTVR